MVVRTRTYYTHLRTLLRAKGLNAVPEWADLDRIKEVYESCPKGHHVDHIIPLNNPLICGLHIPENLQVLPFTDFIYKKNEFTSYSEVNGKRTFYETASVKEKTAVKTLINLEYWNALEKEKLRQYILYGNYRRSRHSREFKEFMYRKPREDFFGETYL